MLLAGVSQVSELGIIECSCQPYFGEDCVKEFVR